MTHAAGGHDVDGRCRRERCLAPCRIVGRENVRGEVACRVRLSDEDIVVRARRRNPTTLDDVRTGIERILHTAVAANLLDAPKDDVPFEPIRSTAVPTVSRIHAPNLIMSRDRIRCPPTDEEHLGKTIEIGLVLRELEPRGRAHRILAVAPKGLARRWRAEMRLHCGERFQFIGPAGDFSRRRFLPVFVNDEERIFLPTARRIRDVLLTERIESVAPSAAPDVDGWFKRPGAGAPAQGERIFAEPVEAHGTRIREKSDHAQCACDVRRRFIGRIGLRNVRECRRKRMRRDREARMAWLEAGEACAPDIDAGLTPRVGERTGEAS